MYYQFAFKVFGIPDGLGLILNIDFYTFPSIFNVGTINIKTVVIIIYTISIIYIIHIIQIGIHG